MAKVTIREAAVLLGLSVDTIRRKLRAGKLKGEKVVRKNVKIWLVDVDDALLPKQPARQEPTQEGLLTFQFDHLRKDRDRWRDLALCLVKAYFPER